MLYSLAELRGISWCFLWCQICECDPNIQDWVLELMFSFLGAFLLVAKSFTRVQVIPGPLNNSYGKWTTNNKFVVLYTRVVQL